jgi:hypothetical protein
MVEGMALNKPWISNMQCFDPGLEHEGLGTVHFKVYAEKPG